MSKSLEFIDIQPTETDPHSNFASPSSELEPELDPNSTQPLLSFPCTRVEAGKALGVSDVSIGKWIKKICEAGATILEGDRIIAVGFQILSDYQQAPNKAAFLTQIALNQPASQSGSALAVSAQSSLTLEADFEELYHQVSERYQTLNEREASIADDLAATSAQLLAEYEAQELSRTQEMAAHLREAKMRGITRAVQELKAEEQAYRLTIDRYRREKEEKAANFRHTA